MQQDLLRTAEIENNIERFYERPIVEVEKTEE